MHIRVTVITEAKSDSIKELSPEKLRVTTREPAADNRANTHIRRLIADYFNTTLSAVQIISGHHRPNKMIEIRKNHG